jgi:hypothetical protein
MMGIVHTQFCINVYSTIFGEVFAKREDFSIVALDPRDITSSAHCPITEVALAPVFNFTLQSRLKTFLWINKDNIIL